MSPAPTRRFLPELRRLEGQLQVPVVDRVRILRELEFDLEEFFDRLTSQGIATEDARSQALEVLVPDPRSLRALDRVHQPLYRRMTYQLGHGRARLVERVLLVALVAVVLVGETAVLLSADLWTQRSPFLLPVLALGAVLLALMAFRALRIVVGEPQDPGRELHPILAVSGAILLAGLFGTLVDFYRLASTLGSSAVPPPEGSVQLVAAWLHRDAVLISVSILLALFGALGWFLLSLKLSLDEGARRQVLGLDTDHPTPTGG